MSVERGGAVCLDQNRRDILRVEPIMRERKRVTANRQVYKCIAATLVGFLRAGELSLVPHDCYRRASHGAAGSVLHRAGDPSECLLGERGKRQGSAKRHSDEIRNRIRVLIIMPRIS